MDYEHIHTDESEPARTHKWLTVDQAFMLCQEAGLDRIKKTIRSWCRHDHVEGQKQTTPNGERWMLEAHSLKVKIRSELEFQHQSEPVQTGSDRFEPVRTEAEPVQTRTDTYEQGQTRTNNQEPQDAQDTTFQTRLSELEREVRSLEIDKAVRDKQIDFLSKQNEEGQTNLLSQSRYIGHLETQVMQLGGRADHRFLAAPVASSTDHQAQSFDDAQPVKQHPNQSAFDIHTEASGQH